MVNKLYDPWIGGVESVVRDLSEELVKKDDVELQVLVSNSNFSTREEILRGVPLKRLRNWVFLIFRKPLFFSSPISLSLPYWMKRYSSDIVHLHLPDPVAMVAYFLARPKGKLVITWHSDIVKQKKLKALLAPLESWVLRQARAILATSPNMIKNSPSLRPFETKCQVVPLGIYPERYEVSREIAFNIVKEKEQLARPIVLYVGRLVYYKGVNVLLKAMETVEALLIVIGEGVLYDELIAESKKLGIEHRLRVLPPQSFERLVYHFHLCDIFVLPSIAPSEAFGIVQLEAMVCGKPVISTNLPTGVPYVNQNGQTGIVVEPNDSGDLKDAISTLIENPLQRDKMGQYARLRVLKEFTNQRVAQQVYSVYKTLLMPT